MEKPIIEERSSYNVLLVRKNWSMRIFDTSLFLLGLGFLFIFFEFRSPPFIAGAIAIAVLSIFIAPALFRFIGRPHYKLYQDHLVVRIWNREKSIPLTDMERDFDLPYFYRVRKKRTPLLVSDNFLGELNNRLEVIKRGKKSK
ncbi:hypothetical protein [Hazenella coriacea]|uniref:Uncharacterized protein n=1 Tax=Hazenella coriacea TaxID=1179467 RepID=A0A4R3L3N7_9BACL|nr:hypothetical protein [Hazenella coriacea]TCS93270.1 hypothetical protein EDD58_10885 [Hazenella coriacea]